MLKGGLMNEQQHTVARRFGSRGQTASNASSIREQHVGIGVGHELPTEHLAVELLRAFKIQRWDVAGTN